MPALFVSSAAATTVFGWAPWFDKVGLKPPPIDFGTFEPGTSPALSSPYVQAPFFVDQVNLKRPVVEAPPLYPSPFLFPYQTREWFEPIQLKRPQVEAPPIIPGTVPGLSTTFATSAFFDAIRPKQPIIDNPQNVTPSTFAVLAVVEQAFFDAVQLKRPQVEAPPIIPGTDPAIAGNYWTSAFFDVVRLKQPIIDRPDDLPPLVFIATPQSLTNWFDVVRLLKVPDRLQEAFGAPFPPGQSLTAWFEALAKLKVRDDFPFTKATIQPVTIQNALTDWFERVTLKRPLVETPLVVFFPAQVLPPSLVHNLPIIATTGKLKAF